MPSFPRSHALAPPAGAVWVQAVGYQTAGLAISQLIFIGVCFFKSSYAAAALVIVALVITM